MQKKADFCLKNPKKTKIICQFLPRSHLLTSAAAKCLLLTLRANYLSVASLLLLRLTVRN